jgi:hypothetical protein
MRTPTETGYKIFVKGNYRYFFFFYFYVEEIISYIFTPLPHLVEKISCHLYTLPSLRMSGAIPGTGCWWGSLRERVHWGDQTEDGRIILRWNFRKLGQGVVETGWGWLRIGTGDGHMWVR